MKELIEDLDSKLDDVRAQHKAMRLRQTLESLTVDAGCGEMLPALEVAGAKFAELLHTANAIGKSGALTVKLKVVPLGEDASGCVDVSATVDVKLPRAETRAAMWIGGTPINTGKQKTFQFAPADDK